MAPLSPTRLPKIRSGARQERRPTSSLFAIALLLFLCQAAASAMPLKEYKERVNKAINHLGSLAAIEDEKSVRSSAGIPALLDSVRNTLPVDETIEWDGPPIRVSNQWLERELSAYQQLPFGDERRATILTTITERLEALEERLDEVSPDSEPTVANTKQADKARLEAITNRGEFHPQPPQENIFVRAWRKFKEWLNSMFPASGGLAPGSMSWLSFIAMIVIFAAAAALLAYALSKLIPLLQRRSGKERGENKGPRIVLGEQLKSDQTASDLLHEADGLARKGELRAAIRKAYIAVLVELGDRKVITLAQHKTNRDYLRSVRDKRPLLDEMQRLTNSFENHWYGLQETSTDDWATFRAGYERMRKIEV